MEDLELDCSVHTDIAVVECHFSADHEIGNTRAFNICHHRRVQGHANYCLFQPDFVGELELEDVTVEMRQRRTRRDVVGVVISIGKVRYLNREVRHVRPGEHLGRDVCQLLLKEVVVLICRVNLESRCLSCSTRVPEPLTCDVERGARVKIPPVEEHVRDFDDRARSQLILEVLQHLDFLDDRGHTHLEGLHHGRGHVAPLDGVGAPRDSGGEHGDDRRYFYGENALLWHLLRRVDLKGVVHRGVVGLIGRDLMHLHPDGSPHRLEHRGEVVCINVIGHLVYYRIGVHIVRPRVFLTQRVLSTTTKVEAKAIRIGSESL